MKRIFSFVLLFYIKIFPAFAFLFIEDCSSLVGIGYRHDRLDWTIAGPNHSPPLLSKLVWKHLNSIQLEAEFKILTSYGIYIRAYGDYGRIFYGKNRDSDYEGSHGVEFSRSEADANKGKVYDISGGLGYQFTCLASTFRLAPLLGYSAHGQHLSITNGQLVKERHYPFLVGSIPGLDSSYHALWYGPWIGIDLDYQCSCLFKLLGSYEYHRANYRAKAYWNLRKDMPDGFLHRSSHANGHLFMLGIQYLVKTCWIFELKGQWQQWHAQKGQDISPVLTSFGKFVISQPLTRVNWHSYSISFRIGKYF